MKLVCLKIKIQININVFLSATFSIIKKNHVEIFLGEWNKKKCLSNKGKHFFVIIDIRQNIKKKYFYVGFLKETINWNKAKKSGEN